MSVIIIMKVQVLVVSKAKYHRINHEGTKMKIESCTSPESEYLISDFMKTHYSGVLATADSASMPHAAATYYQFNDTFSLYFATKTETQKYKNIIDNDNVAFVIYDEKSQTSVQIFGHAKTVVDEKVHQSIVNNMVHISSEISGREFPPIEKLYAGEYVTLELLPTVIRMAVYARPDSEGDDLYETLLFS